MERGWKPAGVEMSPHCPRCGSSNTKFCYYNNYSLTQPRYFCKGCRRYWTKGGSLRNVPVGGGCRKNRRGKSFGLQILGVSSRNFPSRVVPTQSMGHSYGGKANTGSAAESNNSSAMSDDGSHIDLALVFANFVNNKQPDNKSGFEMPSEFDPSLEFPSFSNTNMESSIQVPVESGPIDLSREIHLDNNNQKFYSGIQSIHKYEDKVQQCKSHETINYSLPPLPGEDLSCEDIVWSNSYSSINHGLQATQEPVVRPETHDPDLLFGNWSPFDLSSDDTFTTN